MRSAGVLVGVLAVAAAACAPPTPAASAPVAPPASSSSTLTEPPAGLAGMPPVTDAHNVYAGAAADMLGDAVKAAKPLVYVPHTRSGEVWTIDPTTFDVVGRYHLGGELQHVVPSWDMGTLYATNDTGNLLTPFDPATGLPGPPIPVVDP
jgi:hypothetical protein